MTTSTLLFIMVGIVAGIASGLFGIGGGLVIVPLLVYLFGYSQHTASAMSLVSMLLPVGGFAVWNYWRAHKLVVGEIQNGLLVGVGLAIGALFGSKLALGISDIHLRKAFAVFLLFVAARLWLH